MKKIRVCRESSLFIYFEGLLDSNEKVIVVYDEAAICSNRDCVYGGQVHKIWRVE
jgi:hypothetical protein